MASLLSLPAVVLSHILDHLDLHNLKKLRCVCKQTKDMVEKPKYLQKFRITLGTTKSQEELLSSTVPWNNFLLALDEHISPEFLAQYGRFIEHLEGEDVSRTFSGDVPLILSHLGPRIKTLALHTVLINPPNFQSSLWPKHFMELKKLEIHGVMNSPDAQKSLFEIILDNCTHHLTHLKIPILSQTDVSQPTESQYTSSILQPVLDYLKRIEESRIQTRLIIEFSERVQLNPEILLSMVRICSRLGVKLLHVPIQGLPMANRSFTYAQREMLEKTVVSVTEIMDKKMESMQSRVESNKLNKNRWIPKNTQSHVRIKLNPRDENYDGFELRDPIYSLDVSSDWLPSLQHPYQVIFQTQRPTVQKLQIQTFSEREESRLMNFGQDISFSFPNLKNLYVGFCTCMRNEDYHALIIGLPSLEKLGIVQSNLNDDGLLGDDLTHPLILKMKKLKHLKLDSCDGVTDVSFIHAFRFMNLESLKWTFYKTACQVTFPNGISSLSSIDGGFKDSVQRLEFKTLEDCSRDEVDEFVNKFKALTYFNLEKLRESENEYESESSDDDDDDDDEIE